MDPIFGAIELYSAIKIKRSDGRVHLAKVVQLSSESKSVGVEWNEGGETKGKEIFIDLIFELNDELRPNASTSKPSATATATTINQSVQQQQQQQNQTVPTPPVISNGLSNSRLTLDIDSVERAYDSRPPPTLPPHLLQKFPHYSSSAQTPSTPISFTPSNGTYPTTPTTPSPKPTHASIGMSNNNGSGRPIRRPATQTFSSTNRPGTSPSPLPPSTPNIEQSNSPISTITTTTKKPERRLVAQNTVTQPPPTPVEIPEPTPNIPISYGLHGPFGQMILDYRSTLNYKPISCTNGNQQSLIDYKDLRICVAVRKRPLNKREVAKKDNDVVTIPTKNHCIVHVPKTKVDLTKYLDNQSFRFDYTFDERAPTELIYRCTAAPLIETIFNGGNATVFAYGQTGSGKTFTMGGDTSSSAKADYSHGIYAQTARDIFQRLSLPEYRSTIEIFVTFYEIYCGKVFDLLNNKKRLRVLEDQKGLVQVCDRKEQQVKSVQDVLNIIQYGMGIRTSGTTSANANSSRSHAILQLILKTSTPLTSQSNIPPVSSSSSRPNTPAGPRRLVKEVGKMSLIDLAGSERGKDTASGDRTQRMEGSEINKSLLALKECIRALGRGDGAHVPFRGSTLTKVLRDSFIGDKSKVCMIAMVSPTHSDVENTMNTLRYADRVKELAANGNDDDTNRNEQEISSVLPMVKNVQSNSSTHHHHHSHHNTGAEFSNNYQDDEEQEEQDEAEEEEDNEAMMSYAEQIEHLQAYEESLFDTCQDFLTNQEPFLTQQLRSIVKHAQETVDYDQEKFVNDMRSNLLQRQHMLDELQQRLQSFADCLQQEEQVAAEQREKHQHHHHYNGHGH